MSRKLIIVIKGSVCDYKANMYAGDVNNLILVMKRISKFIF
jgi:hypothetical protein